MQDRFAFGLSRPPIDSQQDWTLIRGENSNGHAVLEFWRKWVTCDERDRDIMVINKHYAHKIALLWTPYGVFIC